MIAKWVDAKQKMIQTSFISLSTICINQTLFIITMIMLEQQNVMHISVVAHSHHCTCSRMPCLTSCSH